MKAKLTKPEWAPDFGSTTFVSSWGATVTGVRKFLIAYNINLVSTKEQAHRIALNLRSQGKQKYKNYAASVLMYLLKHLLTYIFARFIWNAEISVRVAIHCYERLF